MTGYKRKLIFKLLFNVSGAMIIYFCYADLLIHETLENNQLVVIWYGEYIPVKSNKGIVKVDGFWSDEHRSRGSRLCAVTSARVDGRVSME
jgi:hypothetical protein